MAFPVQEDLPVRGNYIILVKIKTREADYGGKQAAFLKNTIQEYLEKEEWKLGLVRNFLLDPIKGEFSYKVRGIDVDASNIIGLKNYIYSKADPKFIDLYYYN